MDSNERSKARCPSWKLAKHVADANMLERVKHSSISAVIPGSWQRIAYLNDRDRQLKSLLDYLQTLGIPMGSEDWARSAEAMIRKLYDEHCSIWDFLRDWRSDKKLDIEALEFALEHAQTKHRKALPVARIICDWCGWPGARSVGDGYAACTDCLPDSATSDGPATTEGT